MAELGPVIVVGVQFNYSREPTIEIVYVEDKDNTEVFWETKKFTVNLNPASEEIRQRVETFQAECLDFLDDMLIARRGPEKTIESKTFTEKRIRPDLTIEE